MAVVETGAGLATAADRIGIHTVVHAAFHVARGSLRRLPRGDLRMFAGTH
jgi:hypothetical protein